VNFKKLGFDIKINILFKVERNSREEFKEYLIKNQNINSVFRVNNGFDFLVEAIFRGMHELQIFMEDIERFNVEEKQELFVLEDLKLEGFLSDQIHAELLFAEKTV
jgi:DNA-binding Lrp family transcriptional regulator